MTDKSASKPGRRARYGVFAFIFGVPLVVFLAWWFLLRSVDTTIGTTFDRNSDQLQRTVIVPTLDTPIPGGKNIIWCASFQLAWNKLKDDVAKGAIQLDQNQQIADRLNSATVSETDVPDGASYSASGFDRDAIADKIRGDMERLFPGTPVTLPEQHPQGVTAYGYLRTSVKFTKPYLELEKGFRFKDGENVKGFGFAYEHEGTRKEIREQVDVLYFNFEQGFSMRLQSFAVDLCRDSQPNQIVLACLSPGATLAETLRAHEKLIAADPKEPFMGERGFNRFDELRVPNMHWRIEHDFKELLERSLLNDPVEGLWIDTARQTIEFSLDRSGANLLSESAIHAKAGPREFFFDKPFLLYVKKRDSEHPFFVMWVENAELLQWK